MPFAEVPEGGNNPAEKFRTRLQGDLGDNNEVSLDVLKELHFEREAQVKSDVERIVSEFGLLGDDSAKISEYLQRGRDAARQIQNTPITFRSRAQAVVEVSYPDKTSEILDLAQQLIRIPSITACPNERLDEVHRAGSLIDDYLKNAGLQVQYFDGKYPAVYAKFPALSGGSSSPEGSSRGVSRPA